MKAENNWRMRKIEKLQTPYFLIKEAELKNNIDTLEKALKKYWNNFKIGYSCKTNSLPWILSYIKNMGHEIEVVSDTEYQLVKKIGFEDKKIIFNGPNKGKEHFLKAIKNKIIVNIDSNNEIEWLKELDESLSEQISVGVRVNFNLEKDCPGETGFFNEGSRFGFSYETGDLKNKISYLNNLKNIKVKGLHIHNTTKTRSIKAYISICECANNISEWLNYRLDYVDIGGGFFGGVPGKTTFDEYLESISKILIKKFDSKYTTLIIEPGSALIGSPIDFVSEVVDVKDTFAKRIVVINGSRNNIDPFFMKKSYFFRTNIKGRNIKREQLICGCSCLDNDRLMELENYPELIKGDEIIFEKVGSYTMALSPLFIEYFPDVYVKKENGDIIKVREKWGVNEFLQNSKY